MFQAVYPFKTFCAQTGALLAVFSSSNRAQDHRRSRTPPRGRGDAQKDIALVVRCGESGDEAMLTMKRMDSILDVKRRLEPLMHVPSEKQHLILMSTMQPLWDGYTMMEYELVNGDRLILKQRREIHIEVKQERWTEIFNPNERLSELKRLACDR